MSTLNYTELADLLFITVEKAGKIILEYYDGSEMNVQLKRDDSPVTDADLASNEIITKALSKTDIPILSEESKMQDFHIRKNWKRYWLIDPLDGTKEFINKNGEFTINIALIEDNIPTLGVVSIPLKNKIYIGGKSLGYSKLFNGYQVKVLKMSQKESFDDLMKSKPLRVVTSRSHQNSKMASFLAKSSSIDLLRMGSSLKFMSIVDQEADIYPRFSPCMEWDTAASDAILRSVGRSILALDKHNLPTGRIEYNKEDLYQPPFVAF